jgi:hypothetical protein
MNMLEPMMCNVWQRGDPLVGFHGKFVHVIEKVMQNKRLMKWYAMFYLHHGWSITQ